MAVFVMDPSEYKAAGKQTTKVINEKMDNEEGTWLMECQIAGPDYLNSAALAKALVDSEELPDRENEYEVFKKQGLKQY